VIGDSFIRNQYTDGARRQLNAQNFLNWWNGISEGRLLWSGNYGVSGQRTDQWLARLSMALAEASDWLLISTPVNDIAQKYPSAGECGVTAFANVKTIINAALAAGKVPICLGCAGAVTFNEEQINQRDIYNRLVSSYLSMRGVYVDVPSVVLASNNPVVFKPRFNYAPKGQPDGVHLSTIGSAYLGRYMASMPEFKNIKLTSKLPTVDEQTDRQILTNALFLQTEGGTALPSGFTGARPAGVRFSRQGGAVNETVKIAASDFGNKLIREDKYFGPGLQQTRQTIDIAKNVSNGNGYKAVAKVHIPAGHVSLQGVALMMQWTVDGETSVVYDMYPLLDTGGWPEFPHTLVMETPVLKVPAGNLTLAEVSVRAYSLTAGYATFEVSQMAVLQT
jgi:lysophospholipase L1-like esterase